MKASINSAFSLRQRSVWEAVDSGVLLWRSNFTYLIPFFAIPIWIIACSLRFLPADLRFVSYIALWWLKPFFDRLALHVVSKRFFGSSSKFKDLTQGLLEIRRGLLGDLLWRRFRAGRAGEMPIRVLEHLGGKQFRPRKKDLTPGGINFCAYISFIGLALEGALLMGEISCVYLVSHMFFPSAVEYMGENMATMENFIFAAFCFNLMLVESLYVCMGFGLYINSRVEVEGWDLQLLFQKLSGPPLKAVLLLCLFFSLSQAAYSEESDKYFPDDFPSVNEEAIENLNEILSSSDFGSEKDGWAIKFKRSNERRERPDLNIFPWLERLRLVFSNVLRFFMILAIVFFAGLIVYWLLKYYRGSVLWKRKNGIKSYARALVTSRSPESLFAEAEDFFLHGNVREAWAACFSGCIASFARSRSLSFNPDATEYDCLALVEQALGDEERGFRELVESWILFAYGGRKPGEGNFERALSYGRSISARYSTSGGSL